MRVAFQGHQRRVSLGTANRTEAAKRAATFWRRLAATQGDWGEAMSCIGLSLTRRSSGGEVKIADWLAEYERARKVLGVRQKTAQCYISAARNIAAMVTGITSRTHPKRADRRAAIDSLPLSKLASKAIDLAVRRSLEPLDDIEAKRRIACVNTKMRNARNLFSRRAQEIIPIELPSPGPFEGCKISTPGAKKYSSSISLSKILADSKSLPNNQRVAVVLAACAGLRRSEIDSLLWRQVDLDASSPCVRIEDSWAYQIKSNSSRRSIPLSADVAEFLGSLKADSDQAFVLSGDPPLLGKRYYSLRCKADFEQLYKWLRERGASAERPLHDLRKEFGSVINEQAGAIAAMELLGHSDLKTTSSIYVENRKRVTVPLELS